MSGEKDFVHLVTYLDSITTLRCAFGVCFVEGAPQRGHFSYDQGFLDRYERENLSLDDHTLKVGFANDGVFSWGEMETAYGPSKAFSVANEFGIVDGLCFSTTVNGFKSIASIALGEGESPSHVDYKGVLRRMDNANLYTSRENFGLDVPDKITEVLKQVANGASINQISESLKLSVSCVRNRQRAAVTRLQAANITEAVYKAAKIGVI